MRVNKNTDPIKQNGLLIGLYLSPNTKHWKVDDRLTARSGHHLKQANPNNHRSNWRVSHPVIFALHLGDFRYGMKWGPRTVWKLRGRHGFQRKGRLQIAAAITKKISVADEWVPAVFSIPTNDDADGAPSRENETRHDC